MNSFIIIPIKLNPSTSLDRLLNYTYSSPYRKTNGSSPKLTLTQTSALNIDSENWVMSGGCEWSADCLTIIIWISSMTSPIESNGIKKSPDTWVTSGKIKTSDWATSGDELKQTVVQEPEQSSCTNTCDQNDWTQTLSGPGSGSSYKGQESCHKYDLDVM